MSKQLSKPIDQKVDAAIVLRSLEVEAQPLFKKLKAITSIESQDDYDRALTLTKNLKELARLAKEKEQSFTIPLNDLIKKARDLFRPFTTMVEATESSTKLLMLEYVKQQQDALKELEEDFSSGKIKRVSTFANKAAEFSAKKSGNRKVWKAICDDPSKTPKKFLVPDVAAITEALKNGEKVNGWVWQQVDQIAI